MGVLPVAPHIRSNTLEGASLPNPLTGWGRGKPGFPLPLLEGQALPPAGAWGNLVSPRRLLEGFALPDPPAGGGVGKPGFPGPMLEGFALPDPRGWGNGETRFPHFPAGRGRGETWFPHTPLREPMFTLEPAGQRNIQMRSP